MQFTVCWWSWVSATLATTNLTSVYCTTLTCRLWAWIHPVWRNDAWDVSAALPQCPASWWTDWIIPLGLPVGSKEKLCNMILYLHVPQTGSVLHICIYLVFKWSQQLCEVVEFPRVKQETVFKLVRADGGVLLAQTMQLKVWHHFHVLLDQSSICVKVSRLLWRQRKKTEGHF